MTKKRDDSKLHVAVVIDVTVDREEWMKKFGSHITSNQLVPAVTLERAVRKAAAVGLANIGMESMEVK